MMRSSSGSELLLLLVSIVLVTGQQQCYFGPGAENRGPASLVPCLNSGQSACCLLGDTCLSGNTCYNFETGDLYQYGCTDITYKSSVCPYKCGWNSTRSPWTALEYCTDVENVTDTWTCHAPESCGCEWNATSDLLVLSPRGCKDMGSDARVALYAPSTLAPYVSLPSTIGGSTGYYSPVVVSGTSTWNVTAISGYTPLSITQLTTYQAAPTTVVEINPGQTASASTVAAAESFTPTASTSSSSSTPTSSNSAGNVTAPATSIESSSGGMSTGAKVGVGVGAAGGVCLIAVILCISLVMRKRRRQKLGQQENPSLQRPQYPPELPSPPGPPMQVASHHGSHAKADWQQVQGTYPNGGTNMPSYFNAHPNSPYPETPVMYVGPPKAQVSPPMELSAEQGRYEMGSDFSGFSSPTPAPTYVEIDSPRLQ